MWKNIVDATTQQKFGNDWQILNNILFNYYYKPPALDINSLKITYLLYDINYYEQLNAYTNNSNIIRIFEAFTYQGLTIYKRVLKVLPITMTSPNAKMPNILLF